MVISQSLVVLMLEVVLKWKVTTFADSFASMIA